MFKTYLVNSIYLYLAQNNKRTKNWFIFLAHKRDKFLYFRAKSLVLPLVLVIYFQFTYNSFLFSIRKVDTNIEINFPLNWSDQSYTRVLLQLKLKRNLKYPPSWIVNWNYTSDIILSSTSYFKCINFIM